MDTSWKIAVTGSGPAGFYATAELFRQKSWDIKVDMFDRLPTPFGLVRGGVAPDHQKIKSVTKSTIALLKTQTSDSLAMLNLGVTFTSRICLNTMMQ